MSQGEHSSRHNFRSRALASVAAVAIVASRRPRRRRLREPHPAFAQSPPGAPRSPRRRRPLLRRRRRQGEARVVSVRVKIANAGRREGLPSQLDNLPPQMREFFRRFGENGSARPGAAAASARPAGRRLRLLHIGRWLYRHEQPRRRECERPSRSTTKRPHARRQGRRRRPKTESPFSR